MARAGLSDLIHARITSRFRSRLRLVEVQERWGNRWLAGNSSAGIPMDLAHQWVVERVVLGPREA
jgi:hypothetical protein